MEAPTKLGTGPVVPKPQPIAMVYDGSTWKLEPIPLSPDGQAGALESVSCFAEGQCIADGYEYIPKGPSGQFGMIEQLANGKWTPMTAPSIAGALDGVTCISGPYCVAVGAQGYSSVSTVTLPLAEAWTGTSWNVQNTANPKTPGDSALWDVSCMSTASCQASGNSEADLPSDAEAETSLAAEWDGRSWSIESSPNPPH